MLRLAIQGASSTNCMPPCNGWKLKYNGNETRKPAKDPASAIMRASPAFFSPPVAKVSNPAAIGTQITRLSRFSLIFRT